MRCVCGSPLFLRFNWTIFLLCITYLWQLRSCGRPSTADISYFNVILSLEYGMGAHLNGLWVEFQMWKRKIQKPKKNVDEIFQFPKYPVASDHPSDYYLSLFVFPLESVARVMHCLATGWGRGLAGCLLFRIMVSCWHLATVAGPIIT